MKTKEELTARKGEAVELSEQELETVNGGCMIGFVTTKLGDTLEQLAQENNTTVEQLREWNKSLEFLAPIPGFQGVRLSPKQSIRVK